jgi:hypothetical protein
MHYNLPLLCLKLKEEITNPSAPFSLIDDDYGIALNCLCLLPTLEGKFVVFWILFYFLKYEDKKTHNMLSLMLDPKFKNLCLIFYFVGRKKGVKILGMNMIEKLYILHF